MLKMFFRRLFCKHLTVSFIRNIYGDEIIFRGWKRSMWECSHCGAFKLDGSLFPES